MALPQSTATAPSAPEVVPVETAGRATPDATGPAKKGKPARRRRRWPDLRRWVSVLAILGLWQIASGSGLIPTTKLAAPSTVASTAWHLIQSGQLGDAMAVSLRRVALGLVIGCITGVVLGLLSGLYRWGDALVDPPLQMLRTLPHLGLVPLFILWFGIGEEPKVVLIALGVTFPLYLNVHSAVRAVDRRLIEAATVFRFSRWQLIRHVIFPSALPQLLVGLRQGIGIAWLTLIVSEQVNANSGLGYMINNARDFLQTDVIVVGLVVYAVLGLLSDWIVRILERRALAWRQTNVAR